MSELTYYPVSLSTKDSLSRNLPTDEPNDDIEDSGISFQNAIQSLSKQLSQLKTNVSSPITPTQPRTSSVIQQNYATRLQTIERELLTMEKILNQSSDVICSFNDTVTVQQMDSTVRQQLSEITAQSLQKIRQAKNQLKESVVKSNLHNFQRQLSDSLTAVRSRKNVVFSKQQSFDSPSTSFDTSLQTSKRWEALSKRIIKLDQTLSTIEIQTDTQLPESSLFRTTHNPLPSSHSFTPSGIEARLTFLRTMVQFLPSFSHLTHQRLSPMQSSQATTSPLFGGNTPKHPQTTTSATFSPFSKRGRTGLYSPQTKIDAGDLVTAQQGLLSVEEEQKMERRLPGLQHIVNQLEEELSTLKNEDGSEINSHNLPLLALPSSMALSSLLRLISPQTFSFSVLQAVNSRLKELHQLSLQQNSLLESLQRLKAAQKPGILKEDPLITQLKRIEKKRKDLDEKVKSLAQQAIAMEQDLTLMKKQAGQKKGHR